MKTISIEEALSKDGYLYFSPTGQSMKPFIQAGRDIVLVMKIDPQRSLKTLDTILFKRRDGSFVLHRILGVYSDYYWVSGDNSTSGEKVNEDQVLGIVKEIRRSNKRIDVTSNFYLFSVFLWYKIRSYYYLYKKCKSIMKYVFLNKNRG